MPLLEKCGGERVEGDEDNIDEEGVADVLNGSYEEVEDQYSNSVDFEGGERVKLSMHFNHPMFSIDYVCNFVLQSPVSGWEIVVNENFNTASITCSEEKTYTNAMKYCFMNAIKSTRFTMDKISM
jgi:hypothetical protein